MAAQAARCAAGLPRADRERLADRPGDLLGGRQAAAFGPRRADPEILAEIRHMRTGYEEVYGARKTWLELNRREIPASLGRRNVSYQMQVMTPA